MRIVVIGAGAVGGVIAAHLVEGGYDVELVCKYREVVESIENHGLRVEGIKGNLITYPTAVIDISQISDRPDVVLLATKAQDVENATLAVLPYLHDDTMVVSLQNGICEDKIAEIVGTERTIGCVVEWGSTLLGAGRMEVTSDGRFVVGELNKETTHRLFLLKSILEKTFPVDITNNIWGALYSKLIVNSCTTTLGALTGLTLGELLKMNVARKIFLRILTEAVNVARASGIRLEKIGGKINPYELALIDDEPNRRFSLSLLKKHLIVGLVGFKYRKLKSSSLQSLERGRKTEVDYLNGYIVRRANEYNVAVPTNLRLFSMMKDIEQGRRRIEVNNLNEIL